MMMTTQLSTQTANTDIAIVPDVALDCDASDLVIPKILLMQKMSDFVEERGAKEGEYRDSVSGDLLSSSEIIVFKTFKTWRVFLNGEYVRTDAITPENANLPYREDNGTSRDKCMNFYCLLCGAEPTPYLITLTKTNLMAGKRLTTALMRLQQQGKSIVSKVFKLATVKQKNDKGSWYAFDFLVSRDATAAEMSAASDWYANISSKALTVYDEDETKVSF